MHTILNPSWRLILCGLLGVTTPLAGQSIDLGRGELPVRVPSSYSVGTPTPLVILLHGYTLDGARQAEYMGFGDLVDSHRFLFVAPDGTEEASERSPRFWNASEACCDFAGSTVDDVGYIRAVIDEMKLLFNVDPRRVYLVGHSNGGFMSFRMAREHSGTIAAIASLAGAGMSEEGEPPPHPVHVLQIHGTNDETIRFEGGEIEDVPYPGALESVERWAGYNGCDPEGSIQLEALDLDAGIEGLETTATRFETGCRPGGSAELWTILEGSHTPRLSPTFAEHVVEWLLAHPKS